MALFILPSSDYALLPACVCVCVFACVGDRLSVRQVRAKHSSPTMISMPKYLARNCIKSIVCGCTRSLMKNWFFAFELTVRAIMAMASAAAEPSSNKDEFATSMPVSSQTRV